MKKQKISLLVSAGAIAASFIVPLTYAAVTASLIPTADGAYTQWTPNSGTGHYVTVDETNCNGNTDYVSTSTVGNRDSYRVNISSIPVGSVITQINIVPCVSKHSAGVGVSNMKVFYRFNGTDSADAGSYSLNNTTPNPQGTTVYSSLSLTNTTGSTLEVGGLYYSGTKGLRLSKIAATVYYSILPAPSSLVSTLTGGSVKLDWVDNSSTETGFKIERATDGGAYSQIQTVGANVTTYTDTTVSANHTYLYRVRSYNGFGDSDYSNSYAINTYTIPADPTSLTATATGSSSIFLQWVDNATNEVNYKLERKVGSGGSFLFIRQFSANVTTYMETATGGLLYTYRVRASNPAGNSGYSNEASITLP